MRHIATAALAGLMLLAPLARGGEAAAEVGIRDFTFQPAEITVEAGSTVRWVNREVRQYHSVWFEEAGDPEPEYIFPEESFERRFETPGVYRYRCGPHPEMLGTVTVTE